MIPSVACQWFYAAHIAALYFVFAALARYISIWFHLLDEFNTQESLRWWCFRVPTFSMGVATVVVAAFIIFRQLPDLLSFISPGTCLCGPGGADACSATLDARLSDVRYEDTCARLAQQYVQYNVTYEAHPDFFYYELWYVLSAAALLGIAVGFMLFTLTMSRKLQMFIDNASKMSAASPPRSSSKNGGGDTSSMKHDLPSARPFSAKNARLRFQRTQFLLWVTMAVCTVCFGTRLTLVVWNLFNLEAFSGEPSTFPVLLWEPLSNWLPFVAPLLLIMYLMRKPDKVRRTEGASGDGGGGGGGFLSGTKRGPSGRGANSGRRASSGYRYGSIGGSGRKGRGVSLGLCVGVGG